MPDAGPPEEVKAIRAEITAALSQVDEEGRVIGNATRGIYAFYDYDGEPIYVGQTYERLRTRIRRHLTNQRTDAVAMSVLDPFEVADVEVWPFFDLEGQSVKKGSAARRLLDRAEYTVFQQVLQNSSFGAVLNEKPPADVPTIVLPRSFWNRIVPQEVFERRVHPDIRIARRAETIASLARSISERQVKAGLRMTLLTQARRIEALARSRLDDINTS